MATTIGRVALLFTVICFQVYSISSQRIKESDIPKYRQRVLDMFHHAYDGYIKYAYPYDELRPLTCDGHDTWGSFSLTLIDALSTLATIGNYTEFRRVAHMLAKEMHFDIDINASVFETNIRILGGLLSGHLLSKRAGMDLEPGWPCSGPLLRLADNVARKLLPAFDTPTGMPYGTINLMYGVPKGETTVTCTAGVGTFIVEFGTLSRLTGDPIFEKVAMRAMRALWDRRSELGLVGNHIDVSSGKWTAVDAGIGGGIDSYFEYLVKGGIMFQIPELLEQFHEYAAAAEKHLKRDDWYMWANMKKGGITLPMFTSLDGYFPGIQSLLGEVDKAMKTMHNFHQVARQFGFPPEYYNIPRNEAHKGREGYPLRPELIESAVYLYKASKDPYLLEIGVDMLEAMETITKTKCGFATVNNVNTHTLENRMESFFLAETTKYLYLLFDPDNFILNNGSTGTVIQTPNGDCVIDAGGYFFNTEAHPIDVAAVYCCSAQKKEDDKILQDWHDNLDLLAMLDIVEPSDTVRGRKLKDLKEESEILKKKLQEEREKIRLEENLRKIQDIEEKDTKHSDNSDTSQQDNLDITVEKSAEESKQSADKLDSRHGNDRRSDSSYVKESSNLHTNDSKNSVDSEIDAQAEHKYNHEINDRFSEDEWTENMDDHQEAINQRKSSNIEKDHSANLKTLEGNIDINEKEDLWTENKKVALENKELEVKVRNDTEESNVETRASVKDTIKENVQSKSESTEKVSLIEKKLTDLKEVFSMLDEWKLNFKNLEKENSLEKESSLKTIKTDNLKEFKFKRSNLEKIFELILGNDDKNKNPKTPNISNLYNLMHFYPLVYESKPELMMCPAQPFHMRLSVLGEMFLDDNK